MGIALSAHRVRYLFLRGFPRTSTLTVLMGETAMRFGAAPDLFRAVAPLGGDAPVPVADVALSKGAPGFGRGAVAVAIRISSLPLAGAAPAKSAAPFGKGAVPFGRGDAPLPG